MKNKEVGETALQAKHRGMKFNGEGLRKKKSNDKSEKSKGEHANFGKFENKIKFSRCSIYKRKNHLEKSCYFNGKSLYYCNIVIEMAI